MSQEGVPPRVCRSVVSVRASTASLTRRVPAGTGSRRGAGRSRAGPRTAQSRCSARHSVGAVAGSAGVIRENFMRLVLDPTMDYYAARRATGREKLDGRQGPGDPGRQPREPPGHAGDPVRAASPAAQADRGGGRRRLLLPQPGGRLARVADLQHGPDRAAPGRRACPRTAAISTCCSTRGGAYCSTRRARARATGCPVRCGAGRRCWPPAHHLTIVPIRVTGTAEAMPPGRFWPRRLRDKPVPTAPPDRGLLRRADHRYRRRRRGDGVRAEFLPERLRQPLPFAVP